jgi:hypothetical protein
MRFAASVASMATDGPTAKQPEDVGFFVCLPVGNLNTATPLQGPDSLGQKPLLGFGLVDLAKIHSQVIL